MSNEIDNEGDVKTNTDTAPEGKSEQNDQDTTKGGTSAEEGKSLLSDDSKTDGSTSDKAPEDGKSLLSDEDKAPAKSEVPEKYEDFNLPEGTKLTKDQMEGYKAEAKAFGLNQENAQKLVDRDAAQVKEAGKQQSEAWGEIRSKWREGLKSDTEFGGSKHNETLTRAKRTLRSFGGSEADQKSLNHVLNKLGFGDNPSIIKMLARIDIATGEGKTVDGGKKSSGPKSAAEVMFGNIVPSE